MKKIHKVLIIIFLFIGYSVCGQKIGTKIGNIAPEIRLPDPNGDTVALSSLRGKVVLVDFWSSGCVPCRVENYGIVVNYEIFKDKNFKIGNGFTIYSVSTEKDTKNWIPALEKDDLKDVNVVDLNWGNSFAHRVYGVKTWPSNVLIDKNGKIIAKNLGREKLTKILKKYVKKEKSNVRDEQKIGLDIGDIAPEINMPDINGDFVALSSLRGKVVLIYFWSTSNDSRKKQNPDIMAIYQKYKDVNFAIGNGFSVYAVSYDSDKNIWTNTIEKENLAWINVCDMESMYSKVFKKYCILSLPSNVLIDKNGKIIAKNLRVKQLSATLKKYGVK